MGLMTLYPIKCAFNWFARILLVLANGSFNLIPYLWRFKRSATTVSESRLLITNAIQPGSRYRQLFIFVTKRFHGERAGFARVDDRKARVNKSKYRILRNFRVNRVTMNYFIP